MPYRYVIDTIPSPSGMLKVTVYHQLGTAHQYTDADVIHTEYVKNIADARAYRFDEGLHIARRVRNDYDYRVSLMQAIRELAIPYATSGTDTRLTAFAAVLRDGLKPYRLS